MVKNIKSEMIEYIKEIDIKHILLSEIDIDEVSDIVVFSNKISSILKKIPNTIRREYMIYYINYLYSIYKEQIQIHSDNIFIKENRPLVIYEYELIKENNRDILSEIKFNKALLKIKCKMILNPRENPSTYILDQLISTVDDVSIERDIETPYKYVVWTIKYKDRSEIVRTSEFSYTEYSKIIVKMTNDETPAFRPSMPWE